MIALLLLGVVALFGLGLLAFHLAPRGPVQITKYTPVDDARIHASVTQLRDWKSPAAKGFKPTRDDRAVDDLTTRRRLGERS